MFPCSFFGYTRTTRKHPGNETCIYCTRCVRKSHTRILHTHIRMYIYIYIIRIWRIWRGGRERERTMEWMRGERAVTVDDNKQKREEKEKEKIKMGELKWPPCPPSRSSLSPWSWPPFCSKGWKKRKGERERETEKKERFPSRLKMAAEGTGHVTGRLDQWRAGFFVYWAVSGGLVGARMRSLGAVEGRRLKLVTV